MKLFKADLCKRLTSRLAYHGQQPLIANIMNNGCMGILDRLDSIYI